MNHNYNIIPMTREYVYPIIATTHVRVQSMINEIQCNGLASAIAGTAWSSLHVNGYLKPYKEPIRSCVCSII